MRTRTTVVWTGCLAALLLAAARPARADLIVTYTSGSFAATSLGSVPPGSTVFDTLNLNPVTNTLNLVDNVPVTAPVNALVFNVGFTGAGSGGLTTLFDTPRSLTVNGVTQTINNPASLLIGAVIDTLTLSNGPTVTYDFGAAGRVEVTPLGQTIPGPNGITTGTVNASFVLRPAGVGDIPEPSALVLLALGGLGLAGYAWRRRGR